MRETCQLVPDDMPTCELAVQDPYIAAMMLAMGDEAVARWIQIQQPELATCTAQPTEDCRPSLWDMTKAIASIGDPVVRYPIEVCQTSRLRSLLRSLLRSHYCANI